MNVAFESNHNEREKRNYNQYKTHGILIKRLKIIYLYIYLKIDNK